MRVPSHACIPNPEEAVSMPQVVRSRHPVRTNKAPYSKARPSLEALEDRITPSLTLESVHVNTTTALAQQDAAVASSTASNFVVVWTHSASSTNTDIRAQLFSNSGARIGGGEIVVASSTLSESKPAVCMDQYGRFYVAYTLQATPTNSNIVVARFSASGGKLGTTYVSSTSQNEYDPSIACNRYGHFVVSYTRDIASDNQDVYARLYDPTGVYQATLPVANSPSFDETRSSVARSMTAFNISIAYVTGRPAGPR